MRLNLTSTLFLLCLLLVHSALGQDQGSDLDDLKTLNELDNSHLDFDFFSESNEQSWNESQEALELLEQFESHHQEDDYDFETDQREAIEEELEEEIEQEFEPEEIEDDIDDEDDFDDDQEDELEDEEDEQDQEPVDE